MAMKHQWLLRLAWKFGWTRLAEWIEGINEDRKPYDQCTDLEKWGRDLQRDEIRKFLFDNNKNHHI
jgi:hypothetical protein